MVFTFISIRRLLRHYSTLSLMFCRLVVLCLTDICILFMSNVLFQTWDYNFCYILHNHGVKHIFYPESSIASISLSDTSIWRINPFSFCLFSMSLVYLYFLLFNFILEVSKVILFQMLQVEYYFSDINLATTDHLMRFITKDPEGFGEICYFILWFSLNIMTMP